jgi:hypothetical protein
MTSRPGLAASLCACLVLVPAVPAAAQSAPPGSSAPAEADTAAGVAEAPEDVAGRIDGIWGLGWHADSAAVAAALGPPITVGEQADGLSFFVYTPVWLGRDGFLQLWLHRDRGLVGGTWEPVARDCSGMLRRLVRATRDRHPEVPSRTEGAVTRDMLGGDICVAAMEKGAAVTVVWEGTDGTEIRIGTTPRSPKLRMRVLTPLLRELRPQGI